MKSKEEVESWEKRGEGKTGGEEKRRGGKDKRRRERRGRKRRGNRRKEGEIVHFSLPTSFCWGFHFSLLWMTYEPHSSMTNLTKKVAAAILVTVSSSVTAFEAMRCGGKG